MDWTPILTKIADSHFLTFIVGLFFLFPYLIIVGGLYILWELKSTIGMIDTHIQDCNNSNKELSMGIKDLVTVITKVHEANISWEPYKEMQRKTLELVQGITNRM